MTTTISNQNRNDYLGQTVIPMQFLDTDANTEHCATLRRLIQQNKLRQITGTAAEMLAVPAWLLSMQYAPRITQFLEKFIIPIWLRNQNSNLNEENLWSIYNTLCRGSDVQAASVSRSAQLPAPAENDPYEINFSTLEKIAATAAAMAASAMTVYAWWMRALPSAALSGAAFGFERRFLERHPLDAPQVY